MLEAGVDAPPVSFTDLSGGPVERPAGPVVLVFFKVSCPTCQFALPYLERLAKGGLRFVAISQDKAEATIRLRQKLGITFETWLDRGDLGYPASNAFGLTNVPSIFLVEADGRISFSTMGFSKRDFEVLGERAGVPPFGPGEQVPEWKSG